MKQLLLDNYKGIRRIIVQNIDSIISLIAQAENLEKIVNGLGKEEPSLKGQLENQINTLKETIKTLASQTTELFESYESFIEDAVKS